MVNNVIQGFKEVFSKEQERKNMYDRRYSVFLGAKPQIF